MKNIILLFTIVLFFISNISSAETYNTDSTSYPKITKIENNLYNKSFEQDDIYSRLDRIEMSIFNRTNPQQSLSARVDSIGDKLDLNKYFNLSKNELADIEMEVYSRTFADDDSIKRLERLETKVFGAVQSGDPEKRMKFLAKASKNYYSNSTFDNGYSDAQSESSQEDYPTYTSQNTPIYPQNYQSNMQKYPQAQNYSSMPSQNFSIFSTQELQELEDNGNYNTQTSSGNKLLDFIQAYLAPVVSGLLGGSNYYPGYYSGYNNYPYSYNQNNYPTYHYPYNHYRANPNYTCSPYYRNNVFNNMGAGVHIID